MQFFKFEININIPRSNYLIQLYVAFITWFHYNFFLSFSFHSNIEKLLSSDFFLISHHYSPEPCHASPHASHAYRFILQEGVAFFGRIGGNIFSSKSGYKSVKIPHFLIFTILFFIKYAYIPLYIFGHMILMKKTVL